MTGHEAWQTQWPVQRAIPISGLADAVHARVGGLVGAEPTQLYGAVTAATIGADPDTMLIPMQRIEDLSAVLLAGRTRACMFCQEPLVVHTITISPDELGIWCRTSAAPRSTAEWLRGPLPPSSGSILVASMMWVGIPALSVGILSWLPALIAGLRHRRRSWLIAAATFALLLAAAIAIPSPEPVPADDSMSAGVWILLGLWMGSPIYGALQIRPWLASQPVRAAD